MDSESVVRRDVQRCGFFATTQGRCEDERAGERARVVASSGVERALSKGIINNNRHRNTQWRSGVEQCAG